MTLMKNFFTLQKEHKGFTLVELLVVVAIIGILAALVLVALSRARTKADDAQRESDIRQVALAMEMAYDDDDAYPISAAYPTSIASSSGTYVENSPTDPADGNYSWKDNTEDNQTFCVSADLQLGDYFKCTQDGCGEEAEACL